MADALRFEMRAILAPRNTVSLNGDENKSSESVQFCSGSTFL
jgi:hypothetical protein